MDETKTKVRALLDRLPDDCSLDDVLYHLYVVQKVEQGLVDADEGRLIPHEQIAKELRRKWQTGRDGVRILGFLHGARDFGRWREGRDLE